MTVDVVTDDWEFLLTGKQQEYLRHYAAEYAATHAQDPTNDPNCVFDLGQNPAKRPSCTRNGQLPTLRRSGVMWIPHLHRWFLAVELAALSGFPVVEDLALAAEVPRDCAAERYNSGFIGNGMHVANVGCVLACALSCLRL